MDNRLEEALASPMERGKRLRIMRETLLRYSRNKLSEKYNIPVGTIQNYEEGRHGGLTERGAKKIITIFKQEGLQCTLDWLLYGKGIEPSFTSLSFGDTFINENFHDDEACIAKELQLFHRLHKDAIDTIVSDDGMAPFLKIGDIVAGKRYFGENIKRLIGIDSIVQAKNGLILVRKIIAEENSNTFSLVCLNENAKIVPYKINNIEIFSAAPILWIRRKIGNFS